jgi:hypothetical protein
MTATTTGTRRVLLRQVREIGSKLVYEYDQDLRRNLHVRRQLVEQLRPVWRDLVESYLGGFLRHDKSQQYADDTLDNFCERLKSRKRDHNGIKTLIDWVQASRRRHQREEQASASFRSWTHGLARNSELAIQAMVLLGLDSKDDLTESRLNARLRELARQYHPDMPGGDADTMMRINAAATLLRERMGWACRLRCDDTDSEYTDDSAWEEDGNDEDAGDDCEVRDDEEADDEEADNDAHAATVGRADDTSAADDDLGEQDLTEVAAVLFAGLGRALACPTSRGRDVLIDIWHHAIGKLTDEPRRDEARRLLRQAWDTFSAAEADLDASFCGSQSKTGPARGADRRAS